MDVPSPGFADTGRATKLPVPAVGQVAAVLGYLARQPQPVRLRDVAVGTGLAMGSCLKLLRSLAAVGYVSVDPERKRYRLGPALVELSLVALRTQDVLAVARPEMRALAAATGLVCVAAQELPEGNGAVVVAKVEGAHPVNVTSAVGVHFPFGATAFGKALLAWRAPADVLAGIARWGLPASTAASITQPERYLAELARVRAAGFATSEREYSAHFHGVAAPVFGPDGTVVLAIGVLGLPEQLDAARLPEAGRAVRAAADRITAALGGREPVAQPAEAVGH